MTRFNTVHHVPEHPFTLTPVHTAPILGAGAMEARIYFENIFCS